MLKLTKMVPSTNKLCQLNLLIMLMLLVSQSQARFANREDMPFEYDFYNTNIIIDHNGAAEKTVEVRATLLKEQARTAMANTLLYYNENSEKLIILEAKTINSTQEYKISKKQIEDKPLASSPGGFDQIRQILLTFPNIEINSKIYIKYKYIIKPQLDNYFSTQIPIDYYSKKFQTKICSALPLYIKVNDPLNSFNIKNYTKNNLYYMEINTIHPMHNVIVEEPDSSVLHYNNRTMISVSSVDTWEKLASKFSEKYNKIMAQPLPEEFIVIKDLALKKSSDKDRINTVTSLINKKIQYMGDWRSIQGRFFPRNLNEIVKLQLGDCKDFSVSTAAILNNMGYSAKVALVKRGISNLSFLDLPIIEAFNHAMLMVTNKQGNVYWIDPTNSISMSQGVFPDIAGKMALVLDVTHPSYKQISHISPKNSKRIQEEEIKINNKKTAVKGIITFTGEESLRWTGMQLYMSDTQIKNAMFHELSGSYLEEDATKTLILPDLSQREVTDLKFSYKYTKKNQLLNTNLGLGIYVDSSAINNIINTTSGQVSDQLIGPPRIEKNHVIVKGISVKQIEKLNYEINSPWVYFKRKCYNKNAHQEIITTTVIKTMFISNEDLKTNLYKIFKEKIETNVKYTALIVD